MDRNPLFSVIIANYNNGCYLQDAIDSLLAQNYDNWEAIIIDDASPDNSMCNGQPIQVFNNGDMWRDFTYVEDIVEGTVRAVDYDLKPEQCPNGIACRIYNIGCGHPVQLMDFISELETAFGKQAEKEFQPMQPGDVYQTFADTTRLETEMGYRPHWTLHDGIAEFVKWYQSEDNPLRRVP